MPEATRNEYQQKHGAKSDKSAASTTVFADISRLAKAMFDCPIACVYLSDTIRERFQNNAPHPRR